MRDIIFSRQLHVLCFLLFLSLYVSPHDVGLLVQYLVLIWCVLLASTHFIPPWRSSVAPLSCVSSGYVLLTGGTSGLGLSLLHEFAARGFNIIVHGRDNYKIQQVHNHIKASYPVSCVTLQQDMNSVNAAQQIIDKLTEQGFCFHSDPSHQHSDDCKFVDIFVSNAGIGYTGSFLSGSPAKYSELISTHIVNVTSLCELLLPPMLSRRRGRLAVVSSLIACLPSPRSAVYAACKAYSRALTHALSYEIGLENDKFSRGCSAVCAPAAAGVSVSLVLPGPVRTNFAAAAHSESSIIFRLPLIVASASVTASSIAAGILAGHSIIQPGWLNRLTAFLLPKLPLKWAQFICFVLWGQGNIKQDFFSDQQLFSSSNTHQD